MSDDQQGICSLPETLETEQVVEILEESHFLDLAASMETGGVTPELGPAAGALEEERMVEREREHIAGQKRKRVEDRVLEEAAGLFGLSLPTAIVPPSPRQVIASPLPQPPKSPISTPLLLTTDTMTTTLCLQTSYSPSSSSPPLPAVNIQLTSEELQALFGILQQRGSAHNPHPQTPTESACSSQTYLQPIAPKSLVTAVVVPSSSSSSLTLSSRDVIEAQTVVAAKASVKGKKRHCTCKNSQCLKLYCDCFSHEEYCSVDCSCKNCHNNPAFSKTRELTLKMYKGRDPTAFQSHEARRLRGCRCRKTLCLKKYCECFHSGIRCSSLCRCINCKNTDTSSPSPLPQSTSEHPPLSQTTSSPSPLTQITSSHPPLPQDTSSPSPLPQGTSSHPPLSQITSDHPPLSQITSSHPPLPQGTSSHPPLPQGTSSHPPLSRTTFIHPPITTAHSHAVTQIPEDTPSIVSDPECCRLLSNTVSDTLTYNNPSLSQNES